MQACPRPGCGGALVTWLGSCSLCARTTTGTRPPTAEEKYISAIPEHQTNYQEGIFKIGYQPTRGEITRARDW